MNCEEVRARMDEFLDRQMRESDVDRLELHLSSCESCAAMRANREALRLRVRGAVRETEVPPDLGHRVQFAIARAGTPRRFVSTGFGRTLMAAAAALVITAGAYYFRPVDTAPAKETQEQFIARLTSDVPPLMRVGLQQHVHCGVLREYPASSPTLAELVAEKQVSAALIAAVETHKPGGMDVVMAHKCTYHGREYMHVVARGKGHLMSLLITRRGEGEAFEKDLKAVSTGADTEIFGAAAQSGPDAYSVDAFETGGYLVYLVSDSAPAENLRTLEGMTEQVRAALL